MLLGMRRILGFLFCVPLAAQSVDNLQWMAGCWEAQAIGAVFEEQWTKPTGGVLLGAAKVLKQGKAVFHEFMRISPEQGRLVFLARIGSKGVTPFPAKSVKENEIVFENLAHDDPKRIIYRKDGEGMVARVEGDTKGENFVYRRVSCQ